MEETKLLAEFLSSFKYEDLPEAVVTKAKDLTLDQFGVELAASTLPWNRIAYTYARDLGGREESTIINYGVKTTVANAAFANATFGHGFEIDDTHLRSMSHPGCMVIPSALALGEKELCSGKAFITAVVAGYEAIGRIGAAMTPSLVARGFYPTSVLGPLGVAALAGKIWGFDRAKMIAALSMSTSYSAGVMEFTQTGGSVKRMHAGMAAQGGLRAAFMAQAGLSGPINILEADRGFCCAFSDKPNLEHITAKLGKEWMISEVSHKRHCCDNTIHAPLDVIYHIKQEHPFKAEEVDEVIMGTCRMGVKVVGAIVEPQGITDSQFSAPFTLALALVKGSNGFRAYNDENIRDSQVLAMAHRVKVVYDEEIEKVFPVRRAAKVVIKLKDGTTYQERVNFARDTPENQMTKAEVDDKFRGLATVVLPADKAEGVIEVVNHLEVTEDVSGLTSLLIR